MKPSANCLKIIQAFESLRLSPYRDTNKIWTVGWGHVLKTPSGQPIDQDKFGAQCTQLVADAMQRTFGTQVITPAQAEAQFEKDIDFAVEFVSTHVTADTTQAQFDAMVSFTFNIGVGYFLTSSVRTLHNAHKRSVGEISMRELAEHAKQHGATDTIAHAFCAWVNSAGQFTLGLFRRRLAELLVYTGWEAGKAFQTAESFNG